MLCNRLKFVRLSKNMSQEELAKLSGTTQNTISSIENYEYGPRAATALKLANALDVTVEYLFYFV